MHVPHAVLRPRTPFLIPLALGAAFALAGPAAAQLERPPSAVIQRIVDTGPVTNEGDDWETVISFTYDVPGAEWLQLEFESIELAGDPFAGTASLLVITSHEDGAAQQMNAIHCEQWQNHSAYFNGDRVQVEVLAAPGTGVNRLRLIQAEAGLPVISATICGGTDNRQLSNDPRQGRLSSGCTGWMIDDCARCFLTAGHCGVSSVSFNVPLSNPSGSWNQSHPNDQYAVDNSSMQFTNGGSANDWRYFGAFPNSNTGLLPHEAQGSVYTLSTPPPFSSSDLIRITGYGTDSTPNGTYNQAQQTSTGPWNASSGAFISYVTDTTGGNSGSPVVHEPTGQAIGIHAFGGCSASGGANSGTTILNSGLSNALADPQGVCAGSMVALTPMPTVLDSQGGATADVRIDGGVLGGQAFLHVEYISGQQVDVPLVPGTRDVYRAHFPPAACTADEVANFWFSASTAGCSSVRLPETGTFSASISGALIVQSLDAAEATGGWTLGTANDTNSAGTWTLAMPDGSPGTPAMDHTPSGTRAFVTGAGSEDVDGGRTTLISPQLDLTGEVEPYISYWRWVDITGDSSDDLRVQIRNSGVSAWVGVDVVAAGHPDSGAGWVERVFRVRDYVEPSAIVQLRFRVKDVITESQVEVAIDDIAILEGACIAPLPDCNGNGILDGDDILSGRSSDGNGDGLPDECSAPGSATCLGDGSGAACPCGNDSTTPGTGCMHSGGQGIHISGSGSTSVAADDLVLSTTGLPVNNTGIYYVGSSLAPGQALFDGLQCAGGQVLRFDGVFQDGGFVTEGSFVARDPSGAFFQAGSTYVFQYFTRDNQTGGSPCSQFANLSPGYAVTYTP